ncbi:DnaB-like helicase N-terminal domain-containing protein [Streptosporangium sandarakinum]|uniref:DnaB-like helicase N-terminal domain-containing protein n=1 Tax=Streptosporangium sandarakinum TaxID=1260955 RepID=UPI0036B91BF8
MSDQVGALYPPTKLDIHIEQALLGALLLEPTQIDQVRFWLEADDFARPAHQEVYKALLAHADARSAGHADPAEHAAVAVLKRLQHVPNLTGDYLHDLMTACPIHAHPVSYALLVVEADTRRALIAHTARLADLIDQHARGESSDVDHVALMFSVNEHVKNVITRLAARLNVTDLAAISFPEPAGPTAPPVAAPAHLDQQDQLLAALIADPRRIPEVRTLLDPQDFTDPTRARLFALLTAMTDNGQVIDQVTVMARAHDTGILTPDQSGVTWFQQRFTTPASAAPWSLQLAQQVQESSAYAVAATAVSRITAALARPGLDTRQVLAVAARELTALTARQPHHVQPVYEPPHAADTAASNEASTMRL